MKSVLISIQPKWCELIASGKKTIEVRKTRPKSETKFKCYIYCSNGSLLVDYSKINAQRKYGLLNMKSNDIIKGSLPFGNRKVIGEFVCDKVEEFTPCAVRLCGIDYNICVSDFFATCLTDKDLNEYGKGKTLYGWHISDLKIYDKPKELGEFIASTPKNKFRSHGDNLTRPPQSWCYVEEV